MTARLLHSRVSEDEGEGQGPSYFTHEEERRREGRGGQQHLNRKEGNSLKNEMSSEHYYISLRANWLRLAASTGLSHKIFVSPKVVTVVV